MDKKEKAKSLLDELKRLTQEVFYKIAVLEDTKDLEELAILKRDVKAAQDKINQLKKEMDAL